MRLGADNAEEIVAGYDLVADGSDNFATRYLLTEICFRLKKPLIAAALSPFEGQLSSFRPSLGAGHPCYRCLFREPPPPDLVPRCEEAGILFIGPRVEILEWLGDKVTARRMAANARR